MVAHASADPHSVRWLPNAHTTSYVADVDPAPYPHTMCRLPHAHAPTHANSSPYPHAMCRLPVAHATSYVAHVDPAPYAHAMRRLPHAHAPTSAYMVAHTSADPHSVRRLPDAYSPAMYVVHASPNTHSSTTAQHHNSTCCRPQNLVEIRVARLGNQYSACLPASAANRTSVDCCSAGVQTTRTAISWRFLLFGVTNGPLTGFLAHRYHDITEKRL
jgi:hypothetical protein